MVRRYEADLQVVKYFQSEKIKLISSSQHVIFLIIIQTKTRAKATDVSGKMLEVTSSISSLVKIWKICHLYPRCSFVRNLQVVHFPVKHSCLCDKAGYFTSCAIF